MAKLRAATMLALQFSHHENATSLRTSDFAKAEEILNHPSYGNRSNLREAAFIPIPQVNVVVRSEGPTVDLLATIESSNNSEMLVEDTQPSFHVQKLL